jgi:hypothetical protein
MPETTSNPLLAKQSIENIFRYHPICFGKQKIQPKASSQTWGRETGIRVLIQFM